MSSVYDDATVVGGPSRNLYDQGSKSSPDKDRIDSMKPSSGRKPTIGLVDVSDYMQESRSFIVPIGKDGLVAAIAKLDKQLQEVNTFHCCVTLVDI
jgi:hypothetical protein